MKEIIITNMGEIASKHENKHKKYGFYNNTPDIAYYPHSNKIGIRAAGGIRDNFSLDGKIGYYDNE